MKKSIIRTVEDIPIRMPAFLAGVSKKIKPQAFRAVSMFLIFTAFLGWSLGIRSTIVVSETDLLVFNPESKILKDPSYNEEILWFARIIYSETKDVDEQIYVAWVVRNRVETGFRGTTYKEVALSASQFSGLNSFDRNYYKNINRSYGDRAPGWDTAVEVARLIYEAPEMFRPFPVSVRHFYSPIVINSPHWAIGKQPVHEIKDGFGRVRFAFYDGVR